MKQLMEHLSREAIYQHTCMASMKYNVIIASSGYQLVYSIYVREDNVQRYAGTSNIRW